MATLNPQVPAAAGSAITLTAAAGGGDQFLNSGKETVVVDNASGGSITVTIIQKKACSLGSNTPTHDKTFTVPAGQRRYLPPIDPVYYADPDTMMTSITYSGVTSLTVGVFRNS